MPIRTNRMSRLLIGAPSLAPCPIPDGSPPRRLPWRLIPALPAELAPDTEVSTRRSLMSSTSESGEEDPAPIVVRGSTQADRTKRAEDPR
jgi:hypothetical protein